MIWDLSLYNHITIVYEYELWCSHDKIQTYFSDTTWGSCLRIKQSKKFKVVKTDKYLSKQDIFCGQLLNWNISKTRRDFLIKFFQRARWESNLNFIHAKFAKIRENSRKFAKIRKKWRFRTIADKTSLENRYLDKLITTWSVLH